MSHHSHHLNHSHNIRNIIKNLWFNRSRPQPRQRKMMMVLTKTTRMIHSGTRLTQPPTPAISSLSKGSSTLSSLEISMEIGRLQMKEADRLASTSACTLRRSSPAANMTHLASRKKVESVLRSLVKNLKQSSITSLIVQVQSQLERSKRVSDLREEAALSVKKIQASL